jgi:hypothetical protein
MAMSIAQARGVAENAGQAADKALAAVGPVQREIKAALDFIALLVGNGFDTPAIRTARGRLDETANELEGMRTRLAMVGRVVRDI